MTCPCFRLGSTSLLNVVSYSIMTAARGLAQMLVTGAVGELFDSDTSTGREGTAGGAAIKGSLLGAMVS